MMPGITDPTEEYFKDGLWAWVTDQWKKLVATAGGALHVQFAGQEAEVEVKQTAAADLLVGPHGWDGSAWRKLPLLWGYSDVYSEIESQDDVTAANHLLAFTQVPADEVWVITNITAWCTTTGPSAIRVGAWVGGEYHYLKRVAYGTADVTVEWSGHLFLDHNDMVFVDFRDCDLNDDIRAHALGYKMKIAE